MTVTPSITREVKSGRNILEYLVAIATECFKLLLFFVSRPLSLTTIKHEDLKYSNIMHGALYC